LANKLGFAKKNPFASFFNCLLKNVWIKSTFPYALSPQHKGAKRNIVGVGGNKCQVITLYESCTNLSKENKMLLVHHAINGGDVVL
jgi:hypothetical protein